LPDGGTFDWKFDKKIKCPTYARPPTLQGLNIDRCIRKVIRGGDQKILRKKKLRAKAAKSKAKKKIPLKFCKKILA
jgi:hypothetical protein